MLTVFTNGLSQALCANTLALVAFWALADTVSALWADWLVQFQPSGLIAVQFQPCDLSAQVLHCVCPLRFGGSVLWPRGTREKKGSIPLPWVTGLAPCSASLSYSTPWSGPRSNITGCGSPVGFNSSVLRPYVQTHCFRPAMPDRMHDWVCVAADDKQHRPSFCNNVLYAAPKYARTCLLTA